MIFELMAIMHNQTTPVDVNMLQKVLESISSYGMLILFITGLMRRWWVLGWTYDELKEEYDRAIGINEASIDTTGQAVQLAKSNTRVRRRGVNGRAPVK